MTPVSRTLRIAASPMVVAVALGLLSPTVLLAERASRAKSQPAATEGAAGAPSVETKRPTG
jgi:hypothetical protein